MSLTTPTRSLPYARTICRQCLASLQSQPQSQSHQQPPIHLPQKRHRSNDTRLRARAARDNPDGHITNTSGQKSPDNALSLPRWAATPSAMRAPFRIQPANDNDDYPCNEDPAVLDSMYTRFLGKDSVSWLDEPVKWLAVTHKSFDHGRRGYNERLSFMGRKLVELQTGLALLDKGYAGDKNAEYLRKKDAYGRYAYLDPALEGIANVSIYAKGQVLEDRRLGQLGERQGIVDVLRWKPKMIRDLRTSGIDNVTAGAIYAIIGAVAMQKGGQVANEMIRKKVLQPMGVL